MAALPAKLWWLQFKSQSLARILLPWLWEGLRMAAEASRGDVESRLSRLSNDSMLEEYALALVSALEQAARTGGRPAFDGLFSRGFDRVYGWSYRLAEYNPERAEALTLEILLRAARALDRGAEQAGVNTTREPTR